jgi:hypothetical protein
VTIWQSCGSTRIPTSAPHRVSTPATTQWPSLRSPVTVTPTCWSLLPATVSPDRVALVGLHSWSDDDLPNVAEWGIQSFSPDELRENSRPLLDWLASTGCTRVAIHFDVDTIDSNEIVLGLGAEPGGLTSGEVRRIITDIDGTADIVGFTIAEFIPPTSDAPATTPQRLPADLRNERGLTCWGRRFPWGVLVSALFRLAQAAGASSSTATSGTRADAVRRNSASAQSPHAHARQ